MLHSADSGSRVVGMEDGTACNENIRAGGKDAAGILLVHASVHLNKRRKIAAGYLGTDITYLVQCFGYERLSSKSREDRHKENHIHLIQIRVKPMNINVGIDGEAGTHLLCTDKRKYGHRVINRLKMKPYAPRPCVAETLHVFLRVNNHQMHVQGFVGVLSECFHHGESERDVGHERAVHDIDMEEVGFAAVDALNLTLEVAEVGTKDRGCNSVHKDYLFACCDVSDGALSDIVIAFKEREEAFVAKYIANDIGIDKAFYQRL